MYEDRSSKLSPDDRKWLEMRWTWLKDEFGDSIPKKSILALTEPEYFPDKYNNDFESARLYLDRVCQYMQVDPSRIDFELFHEVPPETQVGGNSQALGLYEEIDGRFTIWIEWEQLSEPLYLVSVLAHEVGHIRLLGERRISDRHKDHELLTDLLTIFFGMGVFTANSRLFERSWTVGNMSSWVMSRVGYMTIPMCGHALALYALARNELNPSWASYVRKDVRAYFTDSLRALQSAPLPLRPVALDQDFADQYATRIMQMLKHEIATDEDTSSIRDEAHAEELATCHFCGADVTYDGELCKECSNSIEENQKELAEELERANLGPRVFYALALFAIIFLIVAILYDNYGR